MKKGKCQGQRNTVASKFFLVQVKNLTVNGSPQIIRVILTLFMIVMSTLHTESPLLQARCGVNFHN